MTNVSVKVEGDVLTIKVNLNEEHGPSKSGKTTIVGSTNGIAPIASKHGVSFGLNVFKPKS